MTNPKKKIIDNETQSIINYQLSIQSNKAHWKLATPMAKEDENINLTSKLIALVLIKQQH